MYPDTVDVPVQCIFSQHECSESFPNRIRRIMAVSSLDKDVATRLFRMLAVNEQAADAIKRDHASYAKCHF